MTMFWRLLLTLTIVQSASWARIFKEYDTQCSFQEFQCEDGGGCISLRELCDGKQQCDDGSDEAKCHMPPSSMGAGSILDRRKRQTTKCAKSEWKCRDGTCIHFDGKCDGIVNCPDASDETHALCRNTMCQEDYLFRCTYGACVDGTAKCDGKQDCADNSDELHPHCRNATNVVRGKFQCSNGENIPSSSWCDGTAECSDGSDENVRACASATCSPLAFRCAYGACVDGGSDCNGIVDCADRSDEADELCNRIGSGTTSQTGTGPQTTRPSPTVQTTGSCILPPYPEHGRYFVPAAPSAKPGQRLETAFLNISCDPGFGLDGINNRYCYGNNVWDGVMPQCKRQCQLNKDPSVEYRCIVTNIGTRECNLYEPANTIVIPQCRTPNYYSPNQLPSMQCIEGMWSSVEKCIPECGKVTPEAKPLVIGGDLALRGELPWHVGIYKKTRPYKQICGGSIISTTLVISAAHCFWTDAEKRLPAIQFAVAAGKLYRPWDDPYDVDAQKSDVSDIKIPDRFRGSETNFQADIALVFVSKPFVYKFFVRPVCVNFDFSFNNKQLSPGNLGKSAGWGLTSEDGAASQILKTVDLPYVDVDKCLTESPAGFREYITGDKICAGYTNGTSLCQGDSGGGLVFPSEERLGTRYYIRGIVSTAPRNSALTSCNSKTYTAFTQIISHDHFISEFYRSS